MLFKKSFAQKTVSGVQMGNGTVAFKSVRLNVHCFFVDGVLIDTGAKSLEKLFVPFFKQLDIEKVVMTHFHEDHTGCAAYLQKEHQVPLFMKNTMIEYCKKKADYPLYRQLFWGKRRPFHASPIGDTFQSANATWSVIETPGHAIDHLAFLNQETGQLFTGDLYCQEKTKVVLREESMPVIIESLERVLTYDFDDVFCNHAGHLSNGRMALRNKLNYLLDIQGNILRLYDEGKTPEAINNELFPRKYPITFFSAGEWDSIHIVNSIIKQDTFVSQTL
ncbi:MAG: MBL fold metallo-hydrolase [Bacillaceae bacterium]|nr:MBL fold metallo-hydrolase [Bacillaceae bacterium]